MRGIIYARPGYVISEQDYSQLELRIVAEFSKDPSMVEAYKSGSDLHTKTMELIYGHEEGIDADTAKQHRVNAKSLNFGLVYGMQAKSYKDYAKTYGLNLTLKEAESMRNDFFEAYDTLPAWHKKNINFAQSYGYVESPIGRKRFLRDIWSDDWFKRSSAERQALNSAVQGFGSDLCTSAMADIVYSDKIDHSKCRVIGTVHDAILLEIAEDYVEEATAITKEIMENPSILKGIKMEVPLVADVEIGKGWGLH